MEIISEDSYKGFLSYEKVKSPDYFETWMTRIVINCSLDHIRQKKKHTYMEESTIPFAAEESSMGLEEQWNLYDALDHLHTEDRAFIVLKFFRDQRFKDMAEVLCCQKAR